MDLQFSNDLLNWYWKFGCTRVEPYALSPSDWVRRVYEAHHGFAAAAVSSQDTKPAFAVWGPSQTGKSMLVSPYFDGAAIKKREAGEDGKNSALYWPGGLPAFFVMPKEFEKDPPPWVNLLNPFRLGKDASACLSRFTLGSTTPEMHRYHVQTPLFPIEVKLLNQSELLHVMGRGYDTECLGPDVNYSPTIWTMDKFRERTAAIKQKAATRPGPVNREAYEFLLQVCEVVDSMVEAGLVRYQQLVGTAGGGEGLENWKSILWGLLDDPHWNSSYEAVEALAADLLWDSAKPLTEAYRRMSNTLKELNQAWGKRTVHVDLKVAALFLDMESVTVALEGPPPGASAQSRDVAIAAEIPRLRYKMEDKCILIGLSPSLPNQLGFEREKFGHLQGLVLELIVPLNPAYLADTNFKHFLESSDLLDFPGVGNDANAKFTKIDMGFGNVPAVKDMPTDIPSESRFPKYNEKLFFTRIIKRGKTATIVSLYAKKVKIDAFSIFLALDRNPASRPSELNEGINTWWKYAAPEFYKGSRNSKSPLPLNLVVLWWGGLINEANPAVAGYMTKVKWIYDPLGEIADPNVSNFFALNYYRLVRGDVRDRDKLLPDSFFVRTITSEDEFKRVFGPEDTPSRKSFMRMLDDFETGGAEYYFSELCRQAKTPVLKREQVLSTVVDLMKRKVENLLGVKGLFPEPTERDIRRETLETLKTEVLTLVAASGDDVVAQINHLMRELLNVDYRALKPVPDFFQEITTEYIRGQFAHWITSQCNRVDSWRRSGGREKPNWKLLGLESREKVRAWLEAIVVSLEAQLLPAAEWLRKLVNFKSQDRPDLRRVLALRMGNMLVYGRMPLPCYEGEMGEDVSFDLALADGRIIGEKCPSYKVFLQPFLGSADEKLDARMDSQMKRLLKQGLAVMKRVDQPGDEELRKLCQNNNCLPETAKLKSS